MAGPSTMVFHNRVNPLTTPVVCKISLETTFTSANYSSSAVPSDDSDDRTRRNVLRKVAGASAGAATLPGLAAASDSSDADASVRAPAPEEISEDATVVEVSDESSISSNALSADCRDHFGGTFSQAGIEIGFEGYLGCCEAEVEVSILNASSTTKLRDCNKVCKGESYNAAAIQSDWEVCYYNDEKKLVVTLHTKVWKVTGWVEDTDTYVFT